jgi:hypothetical protein
MNQYVALYEGAGEGCDYTIGCDLNFDVIDAKTDEDALGQVRSWWEENNGGEAPIAKIRLFQVAHEIPVPLRRWTTEDLEETEQDDAEEELEIMESRVADLKDKLAKLKQKKK